MFSDWLDEQKELIVKDLSDVVAIPSVSLASDNLEEPYGKACRQVADFMVCLAEKYGLHAENVENRYVVIKGNNSEVLPRIGIFCHLDVVPAGDGWNFPPYQLSEQEGYYIGRGVGDNKGASIIALHLLRYLQQFELKNFEPFIFYGLNEESGMSDIKAYLAINEEPDLSLVPDVELPVCIGEKSRLVFTLSGKLNINGKITIDGGVADNVIPQKAVAEVCGESITVKANGGHAAFPSDGTNAISALLEQILNSECIEGQDKTELHKLLALIAPYKGEGLDVSYTDSCGDILTMVCTKLTLEETGEFLVRYDCRFPSELPSELLVDKINRASSLKGLNLSILKNDPSLDKDLDADFVEALVSICNKYTGKNDVAYRMGGGTYARYLKNGIGLGIGQKFAMPNFINKGQGGAHQADECIPRRQLWDGFGILYQSLCWIDEHYTIKKL